MSRSFRKMTHQASFTVHHPQYGCEITIFKRAFHSGPRFEVSFGAPTEAIVLKVADEKDIATLATKLQQKCPDAATKSPPLLLENREAIKIFVDKVYKEDSGGMLQKLLEAFPKVHYVELVNIVSQNNIAGVLDVLSQLKRIKSLQLSYYQGAVLQPSATYLNSITGLCMMNTKPMYATNFHNKLESFFLVLEFPDPSDPPIFFDMKDFYTYETILMSNGHTLKEIDICTTHPMMFRLFSRMLNVLNMPRLQRRHISFDDGGQGPDVNYLIVRDKNDDEYRQLITSNLERMAKVFDDELDGPGNHRVIHHLDAVILDNADLGRLVGLISRHSSELRKVIIDSPPNMFVNIMKYIQPLIHDDIPEFGIDKGNYNVFKKETLKEKGEVWMMTLMLYPWPLPLFKHHLTHVRIHIQNIVNEVMDLRNLGQDLNYYVQWLVGLEDVVFLDIIDDWDELFSATVEAVNQRQEKGLKTWPKFEHVKTRLPDQRERLAPFFNYVNCVNRGLKRVVIQLRDITKIPDTMAWFHSIGWPRELVHRDNKNDVVAELEK